MAQPNWINLAGVVNMRDVGGMVTDVGDVVRDHRLLRSDNLQDLPLESVRVLLRDYHLTDVVDLRTFVEVAKEGDGPLVHLPQVHLHHFTLYREDSDESGIPAAEKALPWETDEKRARAEARNGHPHRPSHDEFWSQHYLKYLATRPDSVLAALHTISASEGAAVVHCAAGKDRTGTVVGLALKIVGVGDEQVIADYAASAERVPRILERLRNKRAYAENLRDKTVAQQSPRADTMRLMLDTLQARFGGVQGWLAGQGWTVADTDRMRRKLLG
ncbi:MAG: tyrosine-protein phosphatase [Intrasporangium sp.]|uniref:tyrosine-protein phosphatase n=1 Tax=Intrasporangium sp. TaxID=1925024 RepID=UPI00264943D0|nr:tyrosine-protein phosphatase [Intrasporangium sp.]MDN5796037.1 tyrosine-protein phosphatase [Intrasporangium sp.]